MPTGHYRFRRSLGNVSSKFRGARPDTYPLLSYVLQNRALDLSNVGSLTISDISGNGNNATLYTGIYVSTNGTTDKAIVADASAAGSGNYYLTGKIKPNGTTQAKATIDGSALNLSGLTADVWQDFTTTTKTSVTPDTVAVGWDGGGNYSAAEWSDVRLIDASDNSVVAHWKLYDSAAASLGGYPALDCVGGYHGAHVGCSGGSGEGIDDDVRAIVGLDDKMWFAEDTNSITLDSTVDFGISDFTLTANVLLLQTATNSGLFSTAGGGRYFSISANGTQMRYRYEGGANRVVNIAGGFPFGELVSLEIIRTGTVLSLKINGSLVGSDNFANASANFIVTRVGDEFGSPSWHGMIYDVDLNGQLTWDGTIADGDAIGTVIGDPVTVGQKRQTIPQLAGMDFNVGYTLDGVDDVLLTGQVVDVTTSFDLSIDFQSANAGVSSYLGHQGLSGSSLSKTISILFTSGGLQVQVGASGGIVVVGTANQFLDGGIHTLNIVSDGATATVSVDGTAYGSGSVGTVPANNFPLVFGARHNSAVDAFALFFGVTILGASLDGVGLIAGSTLQGSPSSYFIPESTTAGQDALGNAIENPRPNERVANLSATDAQVTITDNASLDSLNVWAQWFYFNGTNGDIIDFSDGAGTATIEVTAGALASTGLTSPTYYVGNKTTAMANTTTLSAGWNYIAVTFTDFTPTADLLALRTGGHFIAYNEPKVLADLEKNRAATKGKY